MADNFYARYPATSSASEVTSLNGLTGALTLVAGSGITITPAGSNITIASTGASGATVALDNLVSTAVNADINPGLNNIVNLGSGTLNYRAVNTSQILALGTSAKTANTHSSATIDNISSTADLIAGMSVNGLGVPHDVIIGTVGANSVTLTDANTGNAVSTTSTLIGTTITFINQLVAKTQDNATASSAFDTGQAISRSGNITGAGATGVTGIGVWRTGNITSSTATGFTGNASYRSGDNSGTGDSGTIVSRSGNVTSGNSGTAQFRSGTSTSGTTGSVSLLSGNSSAGGATGNVIIGVGTSSGTRGKIKLQDATTPSVGFVWTATNADGSGTWQAASGGSSTFLDNAFAIQYNADPTAQLVFDVANVSPATTRTIIMPDSNVNLSPVAGTGSFANQSLSNTVNPVTINADILPTGTHDIGQTTGSTWTNIYITGLIGNQVSAANFAFNGAGNGVVLVDNSGQIAISTGAAHVLNATDGSTLLDFTTPGSIDLKQSVLNNIVIQSGSTGSRPATPVVGQTYFDTTLAAGNGKPIWWSASGGGRWVDATGLPA